MKFYIILTIALLTCTLSQAQSPDLLEPQGKIPKEFTTNSTTKYKTQLANLNKKTKSKKGKKNRKDKKNKKQFLLESNFAIDDILQSGLVLFNDPATTYVNKVLNQLPDKRSRRQTTKPKAYVLNSPAVNAFATDQGYIFVTLGLLANLENEAQLAFVLSHELIHFYHGHSIEKFAHSKDVNREKKSFNFNKNKNNLSVDQKLFKESLYSKRMEEEADADGYKIFKETMYDGSTLPDVFRILYYSYLPFEDKPFERSFFEDANYTFPNNLWLDDVKAIEPMETKEDKHSSHPASAKRLSKIEQKIKSDNSDTKRLFIVGEEEFNKIKQKARYQIPFLNLYNSNFPEAIYTSYLLSEENPSDLELKKVVGKSLYMHAKYLNYAKQNDIDYSENYAEVAESIQGESQKVYHLLAELDVEEALVLAMRYNWNLLQSNSKDTEIQGVIDDLFIEFASVFDNLNKFANTAPSANKLEESDSKTKSKNDKIKSASGKKGYWQYGLVDIATDANFKKEFSSARRVEKMKEREFKSHTSSSNYKKRKKENKLDVKKGKALGIKKVVVVNPYYLSVAEDKKANTEVEYLRSEEKQETFNEYINDLGKKSKLKVEVLDVASLKSNDIETFNDISNANQYFSQQMDQYNLSLTPGFEQGEMDLLAKKYDTDYFLWTGVISLKNSGKGEWAWVGVSVLLPYFLPFTLYNALTPDYDMFYYAILFDVTTGKRSVLKTEFYSTRDSKTMIKSHVYDTYHQINTRRK